MSIKRVVNPKETAKFKKVGQSLHSMNSPKKDNAAEILIDASIFVPDFGIRPSSHGLAGE